MIKAFFLLLLCGAMSISAQAAVEGYDFASAEHEQRYQSLIKELRCLVCQNQNLADSNADLAKDLRKKTYDMVAAGKSRKEIAQYMTQRYGDFVLYRPPVNSSTVLLWFGPFILLLLALVVVMRKIVKRQAASPAAPVEGLQQAKELLRRK